MTEIREIKYQWTQLLRRSRQQLHLRNSQFRRAPTPDDEIAILQDPKAVKSRWIGNYVVQDAPQRDKYVKVSRREPNRPISFDYNQVPGIRNVSDNFLGDKSYRLLTQLWPRLPGQLLLISSEKRPQTLSEKDARILIEAASLGCRAELHRSYEWVPHFHCHLFLSRTPLDSLLSSLVLERNIGRVHFGRLARHPLSNLVITSDNFTRLACLTTYLALFDGPFFIEFLPDYSSRRVVVAFFFWNQVKYSDPRFKIGPTCIVRAEPNYYDYIGKHDLLAAFRNSSERRNVIQRLLFTL